MTNAPFEIALAICLWLIVYHHVVYPVLLSKIGSWHRASRHNEPSAVVQPSEWPTMTVIVPAYNEATYIAEKIINLAEADYPRDRLKIVLAIDGSTDQTLPLAEAAIREYCAGLDFELVNYRTNVGKVAVLNDCIAVAGSDLIALNDTSALFNAGALKQAASQFSDSAIGVVFATYRLRDAGSEGERAYTRFQTTLKANEAALDSPMGGHGALYFFRRALWTPMRADTINDDFILPMQIIANGARGVYDETIVATELERTKTNQEFRRRVRIGAGNMQQAIRLARLADPRRFWLAFTFVSGKGSRPFMPFIIILAIVLTAILAARGAWFYNLMLGGELLVVVLGVVVILVRSPSTPKILAWLGYLVEGYVASSIGALRVVGGLRLNGWQRSTKSGARS